MWSHPVVTWYNRIGISPSILSHWKIYVYYVVRLVSLGVFVFVVLVFDFCFPGLLTLTTHSIPENT